MLLYVSILFCFFIFHELFLYLQFIEKAPEKIVEEVRVKASIAAEKIALTKNRLALLESSVLGSEKTVSLT